MPNINELRLADLLRDAFGVSFDAFVTETSKGISIAARPTSDGSDMLRMECVLTSRTRMQVEAHPESFSKPLFDTMAHAGMAMRQRSARHIDELYDDRRTMAFRLAVNGRDLRETPTSEWPESWDSFAYEFTVFPLEDHDTSAGLLDEGYDWLVRAYRPLFDLLEVSIEYGGYTEGDARHALSTKYERDARNRALCIEALGSSCAICGFDFGDVYGPMGEGFIHVHHVVPVSRIGPGYVIDPARDLIPVCPNCHAMLHRFDPPMTPQELRSVLGSVNR